MQAITTPQQFGHECDFNGVTAHVWTNFEQVPSDLPSGAKVAVVSHGAFQSDRVFRPVVVGMLDAAHEAGMPLAVVTYEDPRTRTAYKPAERVYRLGSTVLGASDRFGRPVNLVGHSWGTVNAVNVAAAFAGEPDIIQSLTLLTPNGYSGEHAPRSAFDFIKRTVRENLGPKESEPHSLWIDVLLTASMAERFTRAPITMVRAIVGALSADQLEVSEFHGRRLGSDSDEKLANLQKHVPLRAIVASRDQLFPAGPTADNLRAQGFEVSEIDCNHPEAVQNEAKGRALFRVMFGQ